MDVNDYAALNRARVILQSAGIPCVTWLDGATQRYITYYQSKHISFDYLLVRNLDEAAAQLDKYGWWILPRQEPPDAIAYREQHGFIPWRGRHCVDEEPVSLSQRRLSPPVPYEARACSGYLEIQTVILMLDSEWGYSVDAHSQRHPSDSDMRIYPTLGEYANCLITYLLDPNGAAKRGGIYCIMANLDLLYDYGIAIRDPKVTEQLSLENRQYHIDHLVDALNTGSTDYRDHAASVRQQILAGQRGINDAVTEYELVAELRGKKLVPRDPERVRFPAPDPEEARKYHISREALPDDTVFQKTFEQLHALAKGGRRDEQSYLDWSEQFDLSGLCVLDKDYYPWLLDLGHDKLDNNGPRWPNRRRDPR